MISQTTWKEIELLRFTIPDSLYANATSVPSNADFFQFGPDGLLNMSAVLGNAPMFVSQPRFREAQNSLLDMVNLSLVDNIEVSPCFFVAHRAHLNCSADRRPFLRRRTHQWWNLPLPELESTERVLQTDSGSVSSMIPLIIFFLIMPFFFL